MLAEENHTVWTIFQHLVTQARVAGMGGVTGFDYSALPVLFAAYDVPTCEWQFYMEKLLELSQIALRYWNTEKSKEPDSGI